MPEQTPAPREIHDPRCDAYNLAAVLEQEAEEIYSHGFTSCDKPYNQFGLCFSGGGIRSACVSLGVAQSLARHGLFRKVQYLSGVSGGGYMLGALAAWIKRTPGGFAVVDDALALSADPAVPLPAASGGAAANNYPRFLEPDFIRNLRRYASYLTPRLGLLSGDSLTMISIYLRNLLLNLTMMISALFALMLIAQLVAPTRLWNHSLPFYGVLVLFLSIAVCFIIAVSAMKQEIQIIRNASGCGSVRRTSRALWFTFGGCTLLWIATPSFYTYNHSRLFAILFALVLAVVGILATWYGFKDARVKPVKTVTWQVLLLAWFAAAVLVAGIACIFFNHLVFATSLFHLPGSGIVFVGGGYVIFGLPLILASFPIASYLFVGMLGNQFPDAEREWLARFAGYFLSSAVGVAIVIAVAIDGPSWLDWIFCLIKGWGWKGFATALLPGGWIFVTVSGVLLGRSSSTGDKKPAFRVSDLIVAIAPPVFILGVLIQVSWGANRLMVKYGGVDSIVAAPAPKAVAPKLPVLCCQSSCSKDGPAKACAFERQRPVSYVTRFTPDQPQTHHPYLWYFGFVFGFSALALLLARRLDINEFSMHLFYRNRLVRAYPGASNLFREPNVFTNFTLNDDLPLRSLVFAPQDDYDDVVNKPYDGPYPIWGTALNITHGEDLSWQQRKAASFIYSPLFCGWDYVPDGPPTFVDLVREQPPEHVPDSTPLAPFGFRSTATYGGEGGKAVIGTAMAASGAAASPNMGYHTRPGVAALLALFNVRLGWWTGNPRSKSTWQEYAPGAGYLLAELLGSTSATSRYVYLSDGGHFENLGLYELVRRRVGFIIVSDADSDGSYSFSDLGTAIEHCRRDFGVHIELHAAEDMAAVFNDYLPKDDRRLFRKQHYALGTISYPRLPGEIEARTGHILYVKSSLTGDEPPDVLAMRADYPSFPHDSTENQWFNESLFESYRALGEHMMTSALGDLGLNAKNKPLSGVPREFFDALNDILHQPLPPRTPSA